MRSVRKDLYTGVYDSELVLTKTVVKDIDKYALKDVHVKVAEILRQHGLFRPGDAVQYVIVDDVDGRLIGYPILKGADFPVISKKGYDYYWYRRILPVVEKIFGAKLVKMTENFSLDEIKV